MRTVPVSGVGTVPTALLTRAADAFAARHTLADVLQWAREQARPASVSEIVTQDEYTHDVVLPFHDDHFLVFDATWLGSITAVAVWDHQPSADELLAERIGRGWRPTPSRLRDGERVLGYAACAVTGDHQAPKARKQP